jgi:F-type H+-transporting ATPase subunit delta
MSSKDAESGAAVYAEALAGAAKAQGRLAEVGAQLSALASRGRPRDPLVQAFLASGAIRRETKAKKIEAAFRGRADDLLVDFLLVMLRRDRLRLVPQVAAAYEKILHRETGRVPVTVWTAAALPHEEIEGWRRRFAALLGADPLFQHSVRPELVGGAVIRVGDLVADGSVRGSLNRLRARIAAAGAERANR